MFHKLLTVNVFVYIQMLKVHYALIDIPSKIFTIQIQPSTTFAEFLHLINKREKKKYQIIIFEGLEINIQDQIIYYIFDQDCFFIASFKNEVPSKEYFSSINLSFQNLISKSIDQLKVSNSSFEKILGNSILMEKSTNKIYYQEIHPKDSFEGTLGNCDDDILLAASIKHPVAVPFLGYNYNENGDLQLYYEYPEKGSLSQHLGLTSDENKDPLFDDTHKLIISYGLACYIEYLHKNNFKHNFLTTSDIWLDSQFYPHVIFLTEDKINNLRQQTNGRYIQYMPPEDIFGLPDVYFYGRILFYLINDVKPISDNQFVGFNSCPQSTPCNWRTLISECLSNHTSFTRIISCLESDSFINDSIDMDEFESYQNIVMPYRI